jgi:hypothetical protein
MLPVMRFTIPVVFASLFSFALVAPVGAHHSAAAFDTTKEQTVTGTVVEYRFSNPHIYLTINVKKPDGTTARMEIEAGAASVLNGLGFTKDSIKVGEIVTILGNPSRQNPGESMLGKDLHKLDGTYVPLNIASKSAYEAKINAVATSVEGTWFPSFREFGTFMGAAGRWQLTDKGKSAPRLSPTEGTQKDCVPIGEPALMFYPVASSIKVEKDRVLLDVDWLDTTRIVYMDGRAHPPASQTFLHGHSVGRWEGKTLVVETTNFKEHPQGLSMSLPSSAQKKLTERFALNPDGKSLTYSGTVEDPVYLAKPGEWTGHWEYRPDMTSSNQKCDIEIARRFLSGK